MLKTSGDWNEQDLIRGLVDRDEAAFRELVRLFQDKVMNTCYGFLRNREDAEDVAQEVFMEAYRAIDRFRGDSSLSTWIYRISVNKSLNLIQKNKRKQLVSSFTRLFTSENYTPEFSDGGDKPDSRLESSDRIQALHGALAKLPDNQRIAFIFHHFEELAYKEIADIMGTSLSAVESLIHRAKRRLQKELKIHYDKLY